MLLNTLFYLFYLEIPQKSVPLQCVFHSIRFKVNKGWSTAVLLFLCLYVYIALPIHGFLAFPINLRTNIISIFEATAARRAHKPYYPNLYTVSTG